jgi:hypothetical protein
MITSVSIQVIYQNVKTNSKTMIFFF